MNGYTSGRTSHDPMPWVNPATGQRKRYSIWAGFIYAPRPEYDHHNPILADFRENHDENYDRDDPNNSDVTLAGYLAEIDGLVWGSDWSPALQRAWKTHARRVLTKLAAIGGAS